MFLCIVPFDVNACKFGSLLIGSDIVVFLLHFLQMLDMLLTNIFNSKVVYNEDKHDGSPFVPLESHCGGCFIVPSFVEVGTKEIICQFTTLRETIAPSNNLKVHPPILSVVGEIVLIDKFLWDVRKLDSHIFGSIHWGHEVNILDIKICKFCVST